MDDVKAVAKKVDAFFSKYPKKVYDNGEIMLLSGDNPKNIFYLTKGIVREYDISYKGEEIVVNVFKPGSFFPMSWPVNQTPNRYFFEASGSVAVHEAPSQEALDFLKANPDVMYDLMRRLYSGVDGMRRRMAHLMGGSARSRLLFELIIEGRRFGNKHEGGSTIIKISESEIGSRAGLSRETVSREIKQLKESNLITVSRQGIVLSDLDKLEKRLGPDL